jgi:site-specific DNA recombinase
MQLQSTPISPLSPRARKQTIIAPSAQREAFIYVRVSTYAQKQTGFSLPDQIKVCREAARANGIADIPEANVLHDADSGKNCQRKSLVALKEAVKAGRVSIVFCPKVDRLGRNARDCLATLDLFIEHNVELVLVENHIDTRTPMGRLFFTMLAAFAEWESTLIKERTWNGKFEKLSQLEDAQRAPSAGKRSVPYGYRYLDGKWERHPDQWPWVLWMFEQVALGHSSERIARMLNERAVPTSRGTAWAATAVRAIIRHKAYTGQMTRRMQDETFTFAVPPIVPPDLWQLANATIDGKRKTARRNAKHDYLLSSTRDEPLVCCALCHAQGKTYMMGGRAQSRAGRQTPWLHYRCNGVNGHFVSAHKLETAIWQALVQMLASPGMVLEHIARLNDQASKQYQEHEQALAGLHERAAEIRAAQLRLAEMGMWGKLPADILEVQAADLEEQAQEIAAQISLAHVQLEQARAETVPIKDIEDACALLAQGAQEASFEQRSWIVHTLVHRIYADKTHWVLEGRLPCLSTAGMLPSQQREQPHQGDCAAGASIGVARS